MYKIAFCYCIKGAHLINSLCKSGVSALWTTIKSGIQRAMISIINHNRRNMTNYELMVILSPELGEKATADQLAQIREMITEDGGKILNEDIHGMREFAYRIKKSDEGYFAVFNFEAPGSVVKGIEQEFNINSAIFRYLVTQTPANYIFKTLAEYDEEKAKADAEREEERAKRRAKSGGRRKPVAPKKKADPVKKEEPKEEKVEKKEAKEEKKEEVKLEKVDEKLKSIIDDPDIKL